MGAALRWLETLDRPAVLQYEEELLQYAEASLRAVPGVRVFGPSTDRVSVLSFVVDGIHPHDVGTVLDRFGVAVRVGHHCAQPLMARLGVPATARASFAPYNIRDDVDALVRGIRESQRVFGV
jgi:cysteine desulfurase/selenocysteine lyase